MTGGVFNLSSINGSNGITFNGIAAGDFTGWFVSSAGDFNGDGFGDILVGTNGANPGRRDAAGQIYLIYGDRALTSPFELSSLNGSSGVIFNGIAADDYAGISVSSAGDVNGDGVNDILIGAPNADPGGRDGSGQVYLIYGNRTLISPFELSSLNGTNGVIFNGIGAGDWTGSSVSSAGDVNGDGFDDILIGAPGGAYTGRICLVYGSRTLTSPFELSSLNGNNGVIFNGIAAGDRAGGSVFSVGNFNGDGFDDIIIGADQADPWGRDNAGQIYLVYGSRNLTSPFELSSLNGSNGVIFNGIAAGDSAGQSVSSIIDLNQNKTSHILIGARYADPGGKIEAGQVYLIYGNRTLTSPFELSSLNGSDGVVFDGIADGDGAGWSVSSAGDVNGDGVPDILIGGRLANPSGIIGAGQSYLVYGGAALTSPFELSSLNGSNGVIFNGIAVGDGAGWSVSSGGDFNGDGSTDILIAANSADPGGRVQAGQVYIVYSEGFISTAAPTTEPTVAPSAAPTMLPTTNPPTTTPTIAPTTSMPTAAPTMSSTTSIASSEQTLMSTLDTLTSLTSVPIEDSTMLETTEITTVDPTTTLNISDFTTVNENDKGSQYLLATIVLGSVMVTSIAIGVVLWYRSKHKATMYTDQPSDSNEGSGYIQNPMYSTATYATIDDSVVGHHELPRATRLDESAYVAGENTVEHYEVPQLSANTITLDNDAYIAGENIAV